MVFKAPYYVLFCARSTISKWLMITKTCRQMKSSQLQLRTALSSWRTTALLSAAGTWQSLMDAACMSGEAIRYAAVLVK